MTSKSITLHIGLEKTGTTTIQAFLGRNREALLQQGVLYPASPGGTNHTKIAAYAIDPARRDSVRTRVVGDMSDEEFQTAFTQEFVSEVERHDVDRLLLSNEHCSSRLTTPEQIQMLKSLLDRVGQLDGIIFYIRRQDDFLMSSYYEFVNNGASALMSLPRPELAERRYNYLNIIEMWEAIFTDARFAVRRFDREEFEAGDLLLDFCVTAGLDRNELNFDVPQRNVGLSARALEYQRMCNGKVPTGMRTVAFQHKLVTLLGRHVKGPKFVLSGADRKAFLEQFEDSNAKIASRFFPDEDRPLFKPVDETSAAEPLPDLDPDEMAEISALVMGGMVKEIQRLKGRLQNRRQRS